MLDIGATSDQEGNAGAYIRYTLPIGSPKRVDCSRLYELELKRLQAEIDALSNPGSSYTVD